MWNINSEMSPWEVDLNEMKSVESAVEESEDAYWKDWYENEFKVPENAYWKDWYENEFKVPEKRIVQVAVFEGSNRFNEFNCFTKEYKIGKKNIVDIIDSSSKDILRVFYVV